MSRRRHVQHCQGRAAPAVAGAAASLEPGAQLQGKSPLEISVQRDIHHEITVAGEALGEKEALKENEDASTHVLGSQDFVTKVSVDAVSQRKMLNDLKI